MIKTETIKRKTKKKEIKPVMMNFISRKITKQNKKIVLLRKTIFIIIWVKDKEIGLFFCKKITTKFQ